MKKKLTALVVKNLKPETKMVEYFDTGKKLSKGSFALRVSPQGKKTWFLMYTIHGKLRKIVIGTYPDMSLANARKEATNTIAKVNSGEDPQAKKTAYKKSETFSDLWAAYLEHPETKKKTPATMKEEHRKYNKILKPALGSMKVVDIRRKDLNRVIDSVAATSPVSGNRLYALLSVMFNRIALDKDWIDANPMPRKRPLKKEKSRDRVLTHNEIKLLWHAIHELAPNMRDIFKLILLTGQRPGEVSALEWVEVDLDEKVWTIPREKTKSKRVAHMVPLSPQVLAILSVRIDNGSKFVFPSNHYGGYTRHLHKSRYALQKETGVTGWGAHDLRRTAATLMGDMGVDETLVERILNHSLGKIKRTYNRSKYLDRKRVALNKLADKIDRITGGESAKVVELRRQA